MVEIIRTIQNSNLISLIFLIPIAISFFIIYRATRVVDGIVSKSKKHYVELVLNSVLYKIIGEKNTAFENIFVVAGEFHPDSYRKFIPEIKTFLDDIKINYPNFKINFYGGKKIMYNKKYNDFNKIHPLLELISNEKYKNNVQLFITKKERLPYHFFYSPYSECGVAELPHKEFSAPIVWIFKNEDSYFTCFSKWIEKINEAYSISEIFFDTSRSKFVFKDINIGSEAVLSKDNFSEYFIKNSIFRKIKALIFNRTSKEIIYHKKNTGLWLKNWKPKTNTLFTNENKNLLGCK